MDFSQKLLKEYWSEELGSSLEKELGTITVCEHGTLSGYSGIMAFKRQGACILSAPSSLVEDISKIVFGKECNDIWNAEFFENALKERIERIVGPAWLGEIDRNHFKPCHSAPACQIQSSEWKLFDAFISECPIDERDASSLESGRNPTVGVFSKGKIISAAGYEFLMNKLAHIGILTLPDERGNGFAKQAISAITEIALTMPIGIQYWTLQSNIASVSAAKSLGFRQFAETIAIRLKN